MASTLGSLAACVTNSTTGVERIVRMVQQDVVLGDRGEDVGAVGEFRAAARRKGRIAQIGALDALHELHQAVRSSGPGIE